VAFAEWGDLNGFAVVSLRGAPGSRFARDYEHGVRSSNHHQARAEGVSPAVIDWKT
jgi:hypothetical protein